MKQAVIERMEVMTPELMAPPSGHRARRMLQEMRLASYEPRMLRLFTVGLFLVVALAVMM